MKHDKKFIPQERQQATESHTQNLTTREFGSVEEVLRFDAEHTTVPAEVTRRLNESLQQEPQPVKSWWRRWLGSR